MNAQIKKFQKLLISIIFVVALPSVFSANPDLIFTEKEVTALTQLRPLLKNVEYYKWFTSDWHLMHYLRAKDLNVEESVAALKKTIKWRKSNKIDSILFETIIDLKPPYNCKQTAKDGSPIIIWTPGRWDIRRVLLAGNRNKLIRYINQMTEEAHARIRSDQENGKNTTQWIFLLDAFNYNMRQHACTNCFSVYFEWVTDVEKYYPGTYQKLFFVNTPRIFQPLLSLVTGLFSTPTRNALVARGIDKSEWQPELLALIAPDQLPRILGGKFPWP